MSEVTMKKLIWAGAIASMIATNAAGADKLSFDHAAELTKHAKTIVFQEVKESGIPNAYHQQMVCLAENIYFEARAEGVEGKAAVANVTRNRVEDSRWPNTYCEVVQQGPVRESWKKNGVFYPIKHRCQFSWYCDGKKDIIWANYEKTGETIKMNAEAWRKSVEIAIWTLGYGSYRVNDNTKGAVFYYAHNLVYPKWADEKDLTAIVGNHTFMK